MKGTEEITNQVYEPKEGKRRELFIEVQDYSKDMPTTKQTDDDLMRTVPRPRRIITGPILSRSDVIRKPKNKVRHMLILENKRRMDALSR